RRLHLRVAVEQGLVPVQRSDPAVVGDVDLAAWCAGRHADGNELRHEGVAVAVVARVERPGRGREVRAYRLPGEVGAPGRVEGDAPADVVISPAEEGRVDGRRAGRVQLRHEGVADAAEARVEGAQGSREGGAGGHPGQVGVPRGVDGDADARGLDAEEGR